MSQRPGTGRARKPGQFVRHGARILDALRHDPYQPRGKLPVTRCDGCGAVYRAGRWRWGDDARAATGTCPACRRIADRLPAGRLTLAGPYVAAHRDELAAIVRHEGELERAEHPMHRLIDVQVGDDTIEVTTTDIHLPRRIGTALERAHDGSLAIDFSEDAYEIRVAWRR
jgi:hypothetical protein